MDEYLSVKQIAQKYQVCRQTVYDWIRKYDIPATVIAGRKVYACVAIAARVPRKEAPCNDSIGKSSIPTAQPMKS
jgi:hypothetical protein